MFLLAVSVVAACLQLPAVRGQFDDCAMLLESGLGNTTTQVRTGLLAEALAASEVSACGVQLVEFNTVCLAQGTVRDTHRSLSLIASYRDGGGVVRTTQLHLQCVGRSWNLRTIETAASIPTTGTLTTPLRTDCFLCDHPAQLGGQGSDAEHCLRELLGVLSGV